MQVNDEGNLSLTGDSPQCHASPKSSQPPAAVGSPGDAQSPLMDQPVVVSSPTRTLPDHNNGGRSGIVSLRSVPAFSRQGPISSCEA